MKKITVEEVRMLAEQHYNEGGDAIVECMESWEIQQMIDGDPDNEILAHPTKESWLEMMADNAAIRGEYEAAAKWDAWGTTDDAEINDMINNKEEEPMMVNIDIARNLIENAHYVDNDTDDNKEENTMTQSTFTTKLGNTFSTNDKGNYFYMTDANGKKYRIKKSEYEQAKREYELECKTAEEEQAELDEQPCKVDSDLKKPAVLDENGCIDCRSCNVSYCVHRDCMRRNPKAVGGLGECPRLSVKVEEEAKDPELEQIKEEIPGIEDAEAELERNIRKEKKAKKAAKPRRSKDIAYEGHGVTLTVKQVDFINHLPDTCFWENGLDSTPWTDILADEIGGQFEGKPMTTGAMISTICEKGLAIRGKGKVNGKKATYLELTDLGKEVAKELGLE